MRINICENKMELGTQAAILGRHHIKSTILKKGHVNVAFVTGTSQIEMLKALRGLDIDWSKVNVFLLDEFIGLEDGHKASSETFLKENFLDFIPQIGSFHPISRSMDYKKTLKEMNALMEENPIDVAFICIGENGHLAFNDPPADFDATDPYIVVDLERRSKRQQVSEGWFRTLDEVPTKAITMSVSEIMRSRHIIVSCPDQRKAKAVASCLFDDITVLSPAAALRMSPDCSLYLDRLSSSLVFKDGRTF